MRKLDRKGFTLVELLATIVILSLVVSLTVFVAIRVINNTRDKSYEVVVNNIISDVDSYLLENSERLPYVSIDDIEYQCVTVKNLIDAGYFKDDIYESEYAKDKYVSSNNYIYIERDSSKTITKKIFLTSDDKGNSDKGVYFDRCGSAYGGSTSISFNVNPSNWSKEKEVEIKYTIDNLNDVSTINDYSYGYSFNGTDSGIDNENIKKFTINENGEIVASIYNKDGKSIKTVRLPISTIDNDNPVIKINSNSDSNYTKSKSIRVVLNDSGSGIKSGAIVKYGWSTSLDVEPSYSVANVSYSNGSNTVNVDISGNNLNGSYYLWVMYDISDILDNNINGVIKSTGVFNFDNEGPTGTVNLSVGDDTVNANLINVSDVSTIKSYGYYISKSNSCPTSGYTSGSSSYIFRNITDAGTYYVCVKITDNLDNSSVIKNSIYVEDKVLTYTKLASSYKCNNVSAGSSPYVLTYTGNCTLISDGGNNFRMKFLTSGTLVINQKNSLDVALVGGGAGGTHGGKGGDGDPCRGGSGGGGGSVKISSKVSLTKGSSYAISIGAGGAQDTAGGTTTAFGVTATGGSVDGGGRGAYLSGYVQGDSYGSLGGSNGTNVWNLGTYYGAGGGGASCYNSKYVYSSAHLNDVHTGGTTGGGTGGSESTAGTAGAANTGSGGGGGGVKAWGYCDKYWTCGTSYKGGAGGSGIVIIRNAR